MDVSSAVWDSGLLERAESHCTQSAIRLVCAMQRTHSRTARHPERIREVDSWCHISHGD